LECVSPKDSTRQNLNAETLRAQKTEARGRQVELVALRRVAPRNSGAITNVVHHERPLDAGELSQRDNFHQRAAGASGNSRKTSKRNFRFPDRNDLLATY